MNILEKHNDAKQGLYPTVVEKSGIATIRWPEVNASDDFKKSYDRFVHDNITGSFLARAKELVNKLQASHYSKTPPILSKLVSYLYTPGPRVGVYKTLLDVGCSDGTFLENLPGEIAGEGLEINEKALLLCKKKGLVVHGGGYRNAPMNRRYDVIRCSHVIEHMPDYHDFIVKMHALLNINGLLVIYTPNYNSLWRRVYRKYWEGYHDKTHFNIVSKDALEVAGLKLGLRLVRYNTYYMGYCVSSLIRVAGSKNSKLRLFLMYFVTLLLFPLDIILSKLRLGDALYVEFVKA